MEETRVLTTLEEVKAISDPMKYRILISFHKLDEPATVKQIADDLKEVPAKVHYHVKKMEAVGIVKLVYTREIKGIIAKYYEPTARMFKIECDKETVNMNRQLMMAEKQRLISEVYETSKNVFFSQVDELENDNIKGSATFTMHDLYLDEQELAELSKIVNQYMVTYSDKSRKKAGVSKYHLFNAFFEVRT